MGSSPSGSRAPLQAPFASVPPAVLRLISELLDLPDPRGSLPLLLLAYEGLHDEEEHLEWLRYQRMMEDALDQRQGQ